MLNMTVYFHDLHWKQATFCSDSRLYTLRTRPIKLNKLSNQTTAPLQTHVHKSGASPRGTLRPSSNEKEHGFYFEWHLCSFSHTKKIRPDNESWLRSPCFRMLWDQATTRRRPRAKSQSGARREPRTSTCVPSRLRVLTEALPAARWHPRLLDYATLALHACYVIRFDYTEKKRKEKRLCHDLWDFVSLGRTRPELVCGFVFFGGYLGASIPKMSDRQGRTHPLTVREGIREERQNGW